MKKLIAQTLFLTTLVSTSVLANDLSNSKQFICKGIQQDLFIDYKPSENILTITGYKDSNLLTYSLPLWQANSDVSQSGCLTKTEVSYTMSTRTNHGEFSVLSQSANQTPRCAGMDYTLAELSLDTSVPEWGFTGDFKCKNLKK